MITSENVLSMFSSRSFMVSYPVFKPFNHFEIILVHGIKKGSDFTDSHVGVQLSQNPCLKRLYFLHCVFLPPLSTDHRNADRFISGLYSVPLICCLVLCQYQNVLTTAALKDSLRSGNVMPPALIFFLRTAFWFFCDSI